MSKPQVAANLAKLIDNDIYGITKNDTRNYVEKRTDNVVMNCRLFIHLLNNLNTI